MRKSQTPPIRWSWLAALLTGSAVTLLGVLRGLDPDDIVMRTTVATSVVGFVVSFLSSIARFVSHEG
ncbi:MAG: hypothetical protein R3C28_08785 [Pirellulaceae bacterium]|nr:hypothetical protein [Planctomycetales bacterium]